MIDTPYSARCRIKSLGLMGNGAVAAVHGGTSDKELMADPADLKDRARERNEEGGNRWPAHYSNHVDFDYNDSGEDQPDYGGEAEEETEEPIVKSRVRRIKGTILSQDGQRRRWIEVDQHGTGGDSLVIHSISLISRITPEKLPSNRIDRHVKKTAMGSRRRQAALVQQRTSATNLRLLKRLLPAPYNLLHSLA
ncbi:hypothetical protein RvY_18786 [Ramazzottius varieornatus]|uniref:Uncharacterized protein n=1 Tax=Ramazzottius varieornatus TaxID=947166 RepID=A0A1D1W740_RAMVA|nr:hypothetical protein RvY_18786 [Ramazzottius varieornatus]